MKNLKYTVPISVALALALAVPVMGGDKPVEKNKYTAILVQTTSAELPAKAAELVSQASAKTMKQTTIEVVKAALGLNPAAAPAIVGCIAQNDPAMAATAAATAVALIPHMAAAISRAAAAVAPEQAGAIVEAVCRVVPAAYPNVATAVSEVVPGASKQILAAIAAAIPDLKQYIDQTVAGYNDASLPSVPILVGNVASASTQGGQPTLPMPLVSAPFPQLLPQSPGGLGPGNPVPTNGPSNDPTNGFNEQGVSP